MINLSEFSIENLKKIQKVLKIILDELEIQEINRLTGNKILLKRFEKEGIFYEEIVSILNKVNNEREKPILEVLNESIDYQELRSGEFSELERLENENIGLEFSDFSKKDLKENIILRIENLNGLKEIKEKIDKKLKEVAITRVEEIRGQFEEMNEKQEEKEALKREIVEETNKKLEEQRKIFEKLGKQFSSLIPPNSISAFKKYEELLKKISKQYEPLRNALKEISRLQSTTEYAKNYLTPALQCLAAPIKQIEEQMKKIGKMYSTIKIPDSRLLNSKVIISSDMMQVKQETETASEIKEIRTLLQRLTENAKNKQDLTQKKIEKGLNEIKKPKWYQKWWMVYIVYPLLVVIIGGLVIKYWAFI